MGERICVSSGQPSAHHAPPGQKQIDESELRRVCGHFATGVTVVTFRGFTGISGVTVNSFTSVSLDPPLILFCLRKDSSSLPALERSRSFAVNFLTDRQEALARMFASRNRPPAEEVTRHWTREEVPILSKSLAFLTCRLVDKKSGGDHVIILGEVVELGVQEEPASL
ncbi:flavin reductase family protein [Nocardiopsis sp. CNR-923]|uniref:flavin reductase family protein n=1 Tax=Nocardiopsis sp. CNR-923 TaxID=1904965 RepID=UPI0021CD12A9|nr:flavin reductase family protein [Nocardiopsis sp. CNR-923]